MLAEQDPSDNAAPEILSREEQEALIGLLDNDADAETWSGAVESFSNTVTAQRDRIAELEAVKVQNRGLSEEICWLRKQAMSDDKDHREEIEPRNAVITCLGQDKDRLVAEVNRLTESRDAISALFPDDAPHKHSESGVSLLDDVRYLIAERKRIAEERDAARKWIKAAHRFAWAHEHSCPRHDSDSDCNCGLHEFLSRPRPVVESYESELSALRAELAQVRVRLEEAERDTKRLDRVLKDMADGPRDGEGDYAVLWEPRKGHGWRYYRSGHFSFGGKTPRSAIDAAISATTAEPEEGNNA